MSEEEAARAEFENAILRASETLTRTEIEEEVQYQLDALEEDA